MKKKIGLWIDHHKAVMVIVENEGAVTREIRSNIEKYFRVSSGTHLKNTHPPQGPAGEATQDHQYENHLGQYYTGVISFIREADSIWIFGPGKAKNELETCLKNAGLGEQIVGIETVDKMTDVQITAKVRGRFLRW